MYEKYIDGLATKFKNTNAVLGVIDDRVMQIEKKFTDLVMNEVNRINLIDEGIDVKKD